MSATSLADDVVPDWAAIAVIILGATAFAVAQGLTYPLIALLLHRRSSAAGACATSRSASRSRPWCWGG